MHYPHHHKVYGIPAGAPFLATLAEHLLSKEPLSLAHCWVILPDRRSCWQLQQLLGQSKPTLLLPRLLSLNDLENEVFDRHTLPPVFSKLELEGILVKILQKSPFTTPNLPTTLSLARDLLNLLEEMAAAEIPWFNLENMPAAPNAEFLKILGQFWPQILNEAGKVLAGERARLALERWLQQLQEHPLKVPVVFAGHAATSPITLRLTQAILNLPFGSIFLPAFDSTELQQTLPLTHPYYPLQQLLALLAIPPSAVQTYGDHTYTPFVRALMQPPTDTPVWQVAQIPLLRVATFATPLLEARGIALLIKKACDDHKTVTVITADAVLTQHLHGELRRWEALPAPLNQLNPPRIFCLLVGQFFAYPTPKTFLALAKHPYFNWTFTSDLEIHWRTTNEHTLNFAVVSDQAWPEIILRLREATTATSLWPLDKAQAHHKYALQTLGKPALWQEIADFWQKWEQLTDYFSALSWEDYRLLLEHALLTMTPPAAAETERALILTPGEGRFCHSDLVVLAGLNEGNWPPAISGDFWLTSEQRQYLGLPPLERQISLSAYDLVLAFHGKEIYLTRSLLQDGQPTLPSRWLDRLATIAKASAYELTDYGLEEETLSLDCPGSALPLPPPQPTPPRALRPKHFSVSAIQRLLHDPYVFYAKYCLRLNPLAPLERTLNAADWGTLVHRLLETFTENPGAPEAEALLYQFGVAALAKLPLKEGSAHLLRERWENLSRWLIQTWRAQPFLQTWREVKGQIKLHEFTISAMVDRIELSSEQRLKIIDFKTGALPSLKEVSSGLAPQLTLEGLLAQKGAFALPAYQDLGLEYWQLKGYGPVKGEILILPQVDALISKTEAAIRELLSLYDQETTAYLPASEMVFRDYEPLVRRQEWLCTP